MNKVDELLKIKELLDSGIINESDYQRLKSKLFEEPKKISIELKKIKNSDFINNIENKRNYLSNENSNEIKNDKSNDEDKKDIAKDLHEPEKKNYFFIKIFGVILVLVISSYFYVNKHNMEQSPAKILVDTTATAILNDTISNVIPVDTSSVSVEENGNIQSVEKYSFENYKAQKSEKLEKALINYSSNKWAKVYKTLITDAYNSGVIDFAGNYITVLTSQSMGETSGVIVDTRDGKVYDLPPFGVSCGVYCEDASNEFESKYKGKSLIYYSDSTLLVARGLTDNSLTYEFYSFDEEKKEFVKIDEFENPLSKPCEE